jgi:pimeloyl-ACP methyl ester carboxylesterase
MFDGFSTERLSLDEGIEIHLRVGGSGPPLLLLHGYPQIHILWGLLGIVGQLFDVLSPWRELAHHVSGRPLNCGHYLAEEAPKETLSEIFEFLTIRKSATTSRVGV